MKEIREVEAAEILEMDDISAQDRIWEGVQLLSDIENWKFAVWCARHANQNNVKEIKKYLDAVEAYYIFGTMTKKELGAYRAEYYDAYWAAVDNPKEWVAECYAYRASDWSVDSTAHWAAYNAAYWAAKYSASDWDAQIEHLKTVINKRGQEK